MLDFLRSWLAPQREEARARRAHELVQSGVARFESGDAEGARALFERALEAQPRNAEAHMSLGVLAQAGGKPEEAARRYLAAVEAAPGFALAWFNLGALRFSQGDPHAAIAPLEEAARLEPAHGEWQLALGVALAKCGRLAEARARLQAAVALQPDLVHAHEELAGCELAMGDAQAAARLFRQALALDPQRPTTHSNMLLALNCAEEDPHALFLAHLEWAERYARPPAAASHPNVPDPARPLRVGYLSQDMRREAAMRHFLPHVMQAHERPAFTVVCYSDAARNDAATAPFRLACDEWHEVAHLDNADLGALMAQHAIDLLVDLEGHTAGGRRLPLLARKPVPVIASWLGYLNTTGLTAVDWRITDGYASPEGFERLHTERLARMPDCQWCYAPEIDVPDPGPLPAREAGCITFGSFHAMPKLTPRVFALWSRVLKAVPQSRMLVLVPSASEFSAAVTERFLANGVEPARIQVHDHVPLHEYLALHRRVDINLDTFPYTGGTTTFHSLWMGVPVVTLAGATPPSRGGKSILESAALGELVAGDETQYAAIASSLARDLDRLARIRAELRPSLARSPLTDAARFTRALEGAYREMWRDWCRRATGAPGDRGTPGSAPSRSA